jgi:hypothetical protein
LQRARFVSRRFKKIADSPISISATALFDWIKNERSCGYFRVEPSQQPPPGCTGRRNHLHPARSGRRFERPALLFSGGKDSLVMLRCAEKAFGAGRIPYPLLMIDTGHNFPK